MRPGPTRRANCIDYLKTLPSGIRVAYDDHGSLGTTAIGIFVGVGSRDESVDQEGMAHFLEHLVFKGAGPLDSHAIATQMDLLGGEVNAYTTRDYTCYYAKVLTPLAPQAWRLLWNMVAHPWLRDADVARERNVIKEELLEALDDLEDRCEMAYMKALWMDSALTHDVLGSAESLGQVNAQTLRDFYDKHYRPSNIAIAIAGDGTHNILALLEKEALVVTPKAPLPSLRHLPRAQALEVHDVQPSEQVQVLMGVAAPHLDSADYPATLLLSTIIGGQNTSRLWQRLREQDGLVYTVSTGYNAQPEWAEMSIHMALNPISVPEAMAAIAEEMQWFQQEGPSLDDIDRAIIQLETSLAFTRETPEGRMFRLGRYALCESCPPTNEFFIQRLRMVTAKDIQALSQKLWPHWEQVAIGVVGALAAPDPEASIRAWLKSPVTPRPSPFRRPH